MAKKISPPDVQERPHSLVPWIILVLWFIWLALLLYMARGEWGRSRPEIPPHLEFPPASAERQGGADVRENIHGQR